MDQLEAFSFSQPVASTSRAVFTLPFKGLSEEDGVQSDELLGRQALYEAAWVECEEKIQATLSSLHDASLDQIVRFVDESRNETGSLLTTLARRKSIPTGLIIGTSPGSSSLLFTALARQLTHRDNVEEGDEPTPCSVSRIRSRDCTKIKNALRSILAGFVGTEVERDDEAEDFQEQTSAPIQSAASLAPEDLRNLLAWYSHHYGRQGKQGPTLVVLLEDLEAMDAIVLSQILVALRQAQFVDQLPFVFLIGVATSPLALHDFVPKDVLDLLQTETFFVEPGIGAFNALMRGLFIDWLPPLALGPKVYQYLWKTFEDMHHSIDATVSSLQILYIQHFTTRPEAFLTGIGAREIVIPIEAENSSRDLVRNLPSAKNMAWDLEMAGGEDEFEVVARYYAKRALWQCSLRHGFATLLVMQKFWDKTVPMEKLLVSLSEGNLALYAQEIYKSVLAAQSPKIFSFLQCLVEVLERLHSEDHSLPTTLLSSVSEILSSMNELSSAPRVGQSQNLVNTHALGSERYKLTPDDKKFSALVKNCADIILGSLTESFRPSSTLVLHELWFSQDVSILKKLHPSTLPTFQRTLQPTLAEGIPDPDIVVAYRLYRETGKIINLGDWWRAFEQTALDEPEVDDQEEEGQTNGKGKGKEKETEKASSKRKRNGSLAEGENEGEVDKAAEEEEEEESEDEEEEGDVRLRRKQARFLRAVGDLAYAGFLQPTSRKVEHVLKSVF